MVIVYKTTNTVNNKFYIGVHDTNSVNTKHYLGSGNTLKKAIKKYGKDKFVRETLIEFETSEEVYEYESWLVNTYMIRRPDCYNEYTGGLGGRSGFKLSDESRNKMSLARVGVIPWNKGLLDPNAKCNQPYVDKTENRKAAQFKKGHQPWNYGITLPPEIAAKSETTRFKKGQEVSDEMKAKIRLGIKTYLSTPEGKKQRSEQMKKVWEQRRLNKLKGQDTCQ